MSADAAETPEVGGAVDKAEPTAEEREAWEKLRKERYAFVKEQQKIFRASLIARGEKPRLPTRSRRRRWLDAAEKKYPAASKKPKLSQQKKASKSDL